jgi:DNA-binding transcriptional LysR family regulator
MIRLFIAGSFLSACVAPPTRTPYPTPQPVNIALTPTLEPLEEAIHVCAITHPELAVFTWITPASSLDESGSDLLIRLDEPPQPAGFAAPLASEQVVLIAHPDNSVAKLNLQDLQDLFSGRITRWQELGGSDMPVSVWVYPPGDESRQIFDNTILRGLLNTSLAQLAPDPSAMIEAVSNDPGAIGYLPRSWMKETVREMLLPVELMNSLRRPILALSAQAPIGPVLTLLNCLQGGEGLNAVLDRYPQNEK